VNETCGLAHWDKELRQRESVVSCRLRAEGHIKADARFVFALLSRVGVRDVSNPD
jgi:hypothetical protein